METRTKYILQRVCVCERSTIGIRCIEREEKRGRGKKKGKWGKKEKGGKKRRGKSISLSSVIFRLCPAL